MQKKQLTIVIVSLLVVILSVSLAYFTTQIIGKGKDVSVTGANLQIIFTESDGALSAADIEPGWSAIKTFTVENNSKSEYKYNIVIQNLVNTFVTKGYLQYKITSTNNGYNMTEFKDIPKSSVAKDKILAYSVVIPVGVAQAYTIEFRYLNDENVDQSADMGKVLSGTLFITEGTDQPTLLSQILKDNPTRSARSNDNNGTDDFATPLTTTTTGTLFTATESIAGSTPEEVYYYAGNTTNNWVKFGKYQNDLIRYKGYYSTTSANYIDYSTLDECTSASIYNINCTAYKYINAGDDIYWRIIRTNHDKSIRLLYIGVGPDTKDVYIGRSKFNTSDYSPKYAGYKYGEDTSLDTIRDNTTDSTIKTYIDTWYQNNLTDYTKYLSTSAVYCNDRSLGTGQTYSASSSFNFAPYYRIDYDTNGASANPSYNCSDVRDAFSVDNTSAKLDYPISLMTADEIAFAGGVTYKTMSTPYAWFISNSKGYKINGQWWLLSPAGYGLHLTTVWTWFDTGRYLITEPATSEHPVRPVVSLKSCIKYSTGNGTYETPYEIVENSSGC